MCVHHRKKKELKRSAPVLLLHTHTHTHIHIPIYAAFNRQQRGSLVAILFFERPSTCLLLLLFSQVLALQMPRTRKRRQVHGRNTRCADYIIHGYGKIAGFKQICTCCMRDFVSCIKSLCMPCARCIYLFEIACGDSIESSICLKFPMLSASFCIHCNLRENQGEFTEEELDGFTETKTGRIL
jgi:hypothetical protein